MQRFVAGWSPYENYAQVGHTINSLRTICVTWQNVLDLRVRDNKHRDYHRLTPKATMTAQHYTQQGMLVDPITSQSHRLTFAVFVCQLPEQEAVGVSRLGQFSI